MPRSWTSEQAASLAPDAASLKTAQGVASPRKWTTLGRDDDFVWGLAQGSGAQPYQVQIDLTEPAFKCSCPSRKFPCKHGLGLLLLFAGTPSAIPAGSRPEWVNEWAAKRAEKSAKQEAKAAEPAAAPPDPAAQARRREKRGANVAQGVAFLDGWLHDLVRQGFAATSTAGYGFWDEPARRLIDAQAPGLARRVRALGAVASSSHQSSDRTLAELGRLHLLLTASQRRDTLSPEWQQEVDLQLGWSIDQDELRQREGVKGTWFVGAQTTVEEDKLVTRTSYLFSGAGEVAKFMEFHPVSHPGVASLALGRWFDGELVYFPGVESVRALWKAPPQDSAGGQLGFLQACDDLLTVQAARLAANPLADPFPVMVQLTPQREGDRWCLRDDSGATLPIAEHFAAGWELFACAGGQPLEIIGLWDGFAFTPLTALVDGGLYQLSLRPA
ncbi:MAG: SWIM zinc finger family protein [Verrucomicrobiota bacterium]